MKIIEMISSNKNHYGTGNKGLYITVHETGNKNRGANARNHANYINNGSSATWHYTVDDKEVIKHFNHNISCWHCGDGRKNGNLNSIGIEMCINSDGDFNKTITNTIELIQYLMKELNIPIDRVVQHNYWSGKNCPANIRSGKPITWNTFIDRIKTSNKPVNNDVLYRVQVGAFKNKTNAINLSNELKKKGYNNFIVDSVDKLYRVQVGAFKNKTNAINLSNELKKKGYNNFIVEGK